MNRTLLLLLKRRTRGPELIVASDDRDFSSDTGFWTKGAGWSISGGKANRAVAASGGSISSPSLFTAGKTYEITVTLDAFNNTGAINIFVGSATSATISPTLGERKVSIKQAATGDTSLYVSASTAGATCTIDSISAKEVIG